MLSSHVKIFKPPVLVFPDLETLLQEHYKRTVFYESFQKLQTLKGRYFEYVLDLDFNQDSFNLSITLYVSDCHY